MARREWGIFYLQNKLAIYISMWMVTCPMFMLICLALILRMEDLQDRLIFAERPTVTEKLIRINDYMKQDGVVRWAWRQEHCK